MSLTNEVDKGVSGVVSDAKAVASHWKTYAVVGGVAVFVIALVILVLKNL